MQSCVPKNRKYSGFDSETTCHSGTLLPCKKGHMKSLRKGSAELGSPLVKYKTEVSIPSLRSAATGKLALPVRLAPV